MILIYCYFTVAILFCCRKPGVTGRGLYELKEEYLKEYNPFFYHYTRIEQSKVHSYVTANDGKWFQLCQRNLELIVHIVLQSFLVSIYKQAKIYVGKSLALHIFCFLLSVHELDNRNASIG